MRDPLYSPDDVVYGQLANDAMVKPGVGRQQLPDGRPDHPGGLPGWQGAVAKASC